MHLHVDYCAHTSCLYLLGAWSDGHTPLRIHGPFGRTPKIGTQGMVNGMQQMLKWHLEAVDVFPIGDGCEIEF